MQVRLEIDRGMSTLEIEQYSSGKNVLGRYGAIVVFQGTFKEGSRDI